MVISSRGCRGSLVFLMLPLLACASTPPAASQPNDAAHAGADHAGVRPELHCTQASNGDESACTAKGKDCHLGAPLRCSGTPPPPGVVEEQQKEAATSSAPCMCVCPVDVKLCSEVP